MTGARDAPLAALRGAPACVVDHADHCVTCGDDGVPMTVLSDAGDGLARCAGDDGAESFVDLTLVAPAAPGARILVHAGVAIVALGDEAPARPAARGPVGA